MSSCQSDTWILPLPDEFKQRVIETTRSMVAAWADVKQENLVFTSIYGIRMYRHGSQVHMHRDRRRTHVLSAILEIGSLPLRHTGSDPVRASQWPLQILDHAGALHA